MDSHEMLPECQVLFNDHSKGQAIIERKLDKALDKLGTLTTDIAVLKQGQINHLKSQDKSLDRLWKVVLVMIGAVGGGGTAAGIVNWVA